MTAKSLFPATVLTALSLVMFGCSKTSTEHVDAHQVPGSGLLNDQGDGHVVAGVTFNVTPAFIRICDHPDLREQADVEWNALPVGSHTVTIWVDDGKTSPKKWFYGGAQGHAKTGNWVNGSTTLRMIDGTGKVLATRHIHAIQCLDSSPRSNR